jgi:tetratricopeptide (TPR) repeat protein
MGDRGWINIKRGAILLLTIWTLGLGPTLAQSSPAQPGLTQSGLTQSGLTQSGLTQSELAQATSPPQAPFYPYPASFWEKFERLRIDPELQHLVEEDLEKSLVIRQQIQTEVDRTFSHTTSLLNVLLGVLTAMPVLIAAGFWFIRRSVINQVLSETRKQLRDEVEQQLDREVAAELKAQAAAFQVELTGLRQDFSQQLQQMRRLFSDAQAEKDQIIQELASILPTPDRETDLPDLHQKVQALTQQLTELLSANQQLALSASDYIEQAKASYFEGNYDQAISLFDQALQLEPEDGKVWYYLGLTFSKKQQYYPAIHAYNEALRLKPDLYQAHFSKARCYAIQQQDDLTLVALKKAIRIGGDRVQDVVASDPLFESIRSQLSAKLEDESEDPIDDLIDQDD